MQSSRPKRVSTLSGVDVSPQKLRRNKDTENLDEFGETDTLPAGEGSKFMLREMKDALHDVGVRDKRNHRDSTSLNFEDETAVVTLSGVENYFLQGKIAQSNNIRVKRNKGRYIPHQADSNLCEEVNEDDKEDDCSEKKFSRCDLGLLRDYLKEEDARTKDNEIFNEITKSFHWWTFCLAGGFNILLYGVGSKRALLEEFRATQLSEFRTLTIDGFKEDVNAKSILTNIVECLKLKDCEQKRRSPNELVQHVVSAIERSNKTQLIILLNNIDGPNLRDPADQSVLATLAESPAVLMVATVDHINATLLHTNRQLQSFNWIYIRADTFVFSWHEILAGHSSILGLNPKSNQSVHSLSSLDMFWQSLAANSRSILRLLYGMFLTSSESVPYWDLYSAAKDEFLVSSETALRQQLVEFSDHRIIRWKRGEDGIELLVSCLDRKLVEKFFTEKGLNLETV